ncbi:MAG TPA: hypothetical protein VGX95_03910 [Xanthobacteraceae bacterium]|jgi:hypothetical protein|nr:hypothetical protein [Xanthobacteraceae bacterium]
MHDSKSTSWRPDEFARKWHALAQRRRKHLSELYQSGAWKRFRTEETLRAHMREAGHEEERWGALLGDETSGEAGHPEAPATNPRAA